MRHLQRRFNHFRLRGRGHVDDPWFSFSSLQVRIGLIGPMMLLMSDRCARVLDMGPSLPAGHSSGDDGGSGCTTCFRHFPERKGIVGGLAIRLRSLQYLAVDRPQWKERPPPDPLAGSGAGLPRHYQRMAHVGGLIFSSTSSPQPYQGGLL